jgi:signal transduction histidine kinase
MAIFRAMNQKVKVPYKYALIYKRKKIYIFIPENSHEMLRTTLRIALFLSLGLTGPLNAQDFFRIDSLLTLLNENSHDTLRCRIMLDIAGEIGSSDTISAKEYLEQGYLLAQKTNDAKSQGRYFMITGLIHANTGEYDQALVNYDRALALFSEANDHLRYYETVKNKGNVYLFTADYTQALNHYNAALDFYKRNNLVIGITRCLNNMGIIYKNRGEYGEALSAYEESIIHLDTIEHAYDIAQAYINMGNVFVYLGVYEDALDYYNRALEISRQENFRKNISLCLSNSGVVQNKLGNHREALNLYREALEESHRLNDPVQISNCLINIGTNYADMGQYETGIDYVNRGMTIKLELEDERTISNCNIYLAEIHVMMEEYDRATELFNTAIPVKEELGDLDGLVRCYLGLGSVFLDQQRYADARAITVRGLEMADSLDAMEHLAHGYEIMEEIALARGDYRHAYEHAELHHMFEDSLMNETAARAAMELEFSNRSKALERENENLRIQSDLTTALMRKRNALLLSVLGFTMLLVAGLVLLSYFLRKLRIATQKLEENNLVITKQNLKLDQLNTNKDQMMSIIAHDLRGTIGNQLTAIEVIHNLECENEQGIDRQKLFGNLKHSASYSLELLENLLHWSRLGENETNFHPEEVNLISLIDNCVALYDEAASLKNLTVKTESNRPIHCKVDKIMFETIIRNLISNAVKFSRSNGTIHIEAEEDDDLVHVKITDQGIGMDDEQLKKLDNNGGFTRRGTANEKGAGIGLTLVKEFTAMHDGQLRISSKPEKGSSFEVVVPCRK